MRSMGMAHQGHHFRSGLPFANFESLRAAAPICHPKSFTRRPIYSARIHTSGWRSQRVKVSAKSKSKDSPLEPPIDYGALEKSITEEFGSMRKPALVEIVRGWGGRTSGTKEALVKQIVEIKIEAAKRSIPEDQVLARTNQAAQQGPLLELNLGPRPSKNRLVELSVPQLKTQLTSLNLSVRGNKRELLDRLISYYDEKFPAIEEPEMVFSSDDEEGAQKNREQEVLMAARQRKDKEAELQLLTISEIRNLLRKRRMTIGMGKRKSELIEKLLDAVYPRSIEGLPMLKEEEQSRTQDSAAWRKDLLNLINRYVPGWTPLREDDDFCFWPLLDLKRAAAERGLPLSGTRAELVARLMESQDNLIAHLKNLKDEEIQQMLVWFGQAEGLDPEATAAEQLEDVIRNFPWFDPMVTKYERLDLISHLPSVDTRLADPGVHVVVMTDLSLDNISMSKLRPVGENVIAVQSILQHIDTSLHQEAKTGSEGVSAEAYFVMFDKIWRIGASHLHVQSDVELMLALQHHGQAIESWQALKSIIKEAIVLPIVSDSSRGLLKKLEDADIDYIGSPYTVGSHATHKAKLNETLKSRGYPTLPQLAFDQEGLHSLVSGFEEADDESADQVELTEGQEEAIRRVEEWMAENDLKGEEQAFVVKPAQGTLSSAVNTALTADQIVYRLIELHEEGYDEGVVEPLLRNMMEFSVTVVDTPAGPRAFMPLEIEIDDPETDFLDARLKIEKFFATVEGYTDEAELNANLRVMKEEILAANPGMILYDFEKKVQADPRVKVRSPPRMDTVVTMGIRDAAVKAFQDLRLRDYARIDGYVQLPPKPIVEEVEPEELDEYTPPTVDELAPRLRPSDNSTMIPPWDPPEPPPERETPEWVHHILDDPDFEDMGPYTNPELASQFHGGEFELEDDGFDDEGRPKARIVSKKLQSDEEEIEGVLSQEGLPWRPEDDPRDQEMLHLSDKVEWIKPRKDLVGKSWQEKADILVPKQDNPLDSFTPDYRRVPAAEMCSFEGGTVLITDVNVAPALDPDSLVFKSAAQVGMTPSAFFRQMISNSRRRHKKTPLLWKGVASIKDTILRKQVFPEPLLDWDDYPPLTEREKALPWYHEKFKYRGLASEELEEVDASGSASSDEDDSSNSLEGPLAKQLAGEEDEEEEEKERIEVAAPKPRFTWDPVPDDRGPGEASTSGRDHTNYAEILHPGEYIGPRQRVWIFCGGVGSGADMSVESGMNVYNILKDQIDLIVELFLVSRPCGGRAEKERRQNLLHEHVFRVKVSSNTDINQPPELEMHNIRNPPLPDVDVRNRETWCLPCHLLLTKNAAALQEACEWAVYDNSQPEGLAEPWQRDSEALRHLIRDQLLQSGAPDAGSGWGVEREVVAPVCIDMYELIVRANFMDATVLNLLPGDVGEDGELQKLCDQMGTAYIGSSAAASETCFERLKTADALAALELGVGVVDTRAYYTLQSSQAIQAMERGETLESIFAEAARAVGCMAGDSLCIRPATEKGDLGAVRLDTVEDLEMYVVALQQRAKEIPMLSLSWNNTSIPMPPQPSATYVIERYIELDNLRLDSTEQELVMEVAWVSPHHNVEIEVGLIGVKGKMKALTPAIFARTHPSVHQVAEPTGDGAPSESSEQKEEMVTEEEVKEILRSGGRVPLCPPPNDIVSPETLTAVQEKAEAVGKLLGLAGLASLTGFVNTDTGNLTVSAVNTVPDLRTGSIIFKQALSEEPPLQPLSLLRRLAYQSLIEYEPNGRPIEAPVDLAEQPTPANLTSSERRSRIGIS